MKTLSYQSQENNVASREQRSAVWNDLKWSETVLPNADFNFNICPCLSQTVNWAPVSWFWVCKSQVSVTTQALAAKLGIILKFQIFNVCLWRHINDPPAREKNTSLWQQVSGRRFENLFNASAYEKWMRMRLYAFAPAHSEKHNLQLNYPPVYWKGLCFDKHPGCNFLHEYGRTSFSSVRLYCVGNGKARVNMGATILVCIVRPDYLSTVWRSAVNVLRPAQ